MSRSAAAVCDSVPYEPALATMFITQTKYCAPLCAGRKVRAMIQRAGLSALTTMVLERCVAPYFVPKITGKHAEAMAPFPF